VNTYKHRSPYGKIDIVCYKNKDLLSDKNRLFRWNKNWKDWKQLFEKYRFSLKPITDHKNNEVKRYRVLNEIIKTFWDLVMEDLIDKNDVYKFPKKLGKIQISYNHPLATNDVYDIYRRGKTYKPVFVLTRYAFTKIQVINYICFTRRWRQKLESEIEKGHAYELVKYEHTIYRNNEPSDHNRQDNQDPQE